MNWEKAQKLIEAKFTLGFHLDPSSVYRIIIGIPPYQCTKYDYNKEEGFKITIGAGVNNYVEITWSMLKTVFNDSIENKRIYNKDVFRIHYPARAEQKTGHSCHIHVIGKMFEQSCVAKPLNKRNYLIL